MMYEEINSISLDVTERCNLKCKYCYLEHRERMHDISLDVVDALFEQLRLTDSKSGFLSIEFIGGEPLLNFPIIEYVVNKFNELRSASYSKLQFSIITNGTLIDEHIAKFCRNNLINVQITVDGDEKNHDLMRIDAFNQGTFKAIMNGIQLLNYYNVNYFIRTTLTEYSQSPLEIIKACQDHDIYNNSFAPVMKRKSFANGLSTAKATKYAHDLFDYYEKVIHQNSRFKSAQIELAVQHCHEKPNPSCGLNQGQIAIATDGKIYPCHRFVVRPDLAIGDVYEGFSLENQITSLLEINSDCMNCSIRYMCGGACVYDALSNNDFNLTDEGRCAYHKTIYRRAFQYIINNIDKYADFFSYNIYLPKEFSTMEMEQKNNLRTMFVCRGNNTTCIDLDEDGILIKYGDDGGSKYIANSTLMAIWDLIEHESPAQSIVDSISEICNVESSEIEDEIFSMIVKLEELNLVRLRS